VKKSFRGDQKINGSYEPQLVIKAVDLPSGGEWSPQFPGWSVIHVSSGTGYWLHPRMNCELATGAVLLLSDQICGSIRASQMGKLRLHFFRTEPKKLTGLVTMAEQTMLQNAASDDKYSLRVLPPDSQFSERFNKLSCRETASSFPERAQLLQLFLEVFGGSFEQPESNPAGSFDAKERLRQMLNQMPVSELMEISFSELVTELGCSPRHVSRLFTELVGVSFREKQVELRLTRACEFLATTNSKVVDVALESGYQSTSLFNLMFKQRFGISPARWRDQVKRQKPGKEIVRRWRAAA
jgi:AraC-like DNA-binding protein